MTSAPHRALSSAGVGISFGEFKDRKPHGRNLDVGGEDFAPAAVAGIGLEYFVASNITLGVETPSSLAVRFIDRPLR